MVTMGSVWDRTTEVLAGRGGMLAGIAIPALFLPTLVRDAYVAYSAPGGVAFAAIGGLLSIVVLVLTIWGQLAIIAATSDPATDRAAAMRIATARLPAAIGVSIVLGIATVVTLIPMFALIATAGIDFNAMGNPEQMMAAAAPGRLGLAALYLVVWLVVALFVSARLAVWQPVLVNERLAVRAIARSWSLTAGSMWRIIGVFILFGLVVGIAALAAQSVVGLVFRLILGANNIVTATFLGGVAASAVTTAFIVVAITFVTQLYAALAGAVPRAAPTPA